MSLRRQKITKYPESNVIYIVTDEKSKKDKIYIISKSNPDRFVLPIGSDIKLFTNVIDEAWKFFNCLFFTFFFNLYILIKSHYYLL